MNEGDFSSQIYIHSATYLNLVDAEFLVLAFFFSFFVLSGSPFSSCCADINTTYCMGTAAVMLPILQLLVRLSNYGEGQCCPNFTRWCRRYAAYFTAVGAPFTLRRGSMLPEFYPLV